MKKQELLPTNYIAAKAALAECKRVDECAKWSKKALALASYAKQMRDDAMLEMARKIRARAIERGGKLLEQEKRAKGGDKPNKTGSASGRNTPLKNAIAEAGLTPAEARTMINVARVPAAQFESMVERPKPATIRELADAGTRHQERSQPSPHRNEYIDWTVAVRRLSALPACGLDVLGAYDPYRVKTLREECDIALENLKSWKSVLGRSHVKDTDAA